MTVGKFKIHGHQVIPWRYVTVLAMSQFHVDILHILFSGHTHTHTSMKISSSLTQVLLLEHVMPWKQKQAYHLC